MATKKVVKKVDFSKETLCIFPVVTTRVVFKGAIPCKLGITMVKEDVYTKIKGSNPEVVKFVCDQINKYAPELNCHISHFTDRVALFKNKDYKVQVINDTFKGVIFYRLLVLAHDITGVKAGLVEEDIESPFCGNYPVEEIDDIIIDLDML